MRRFGIAGGAFLAEGIGGGHRRARSVRKMRTSIRKTPSRRHRRFSGSPPNLERGMRRPITTARAACACLALGFLLTGCGHTRLEEVHTYVARDADREELSFVRVTIRGHAWASKTRYEARWKPAAAVDEYFNADTAPPVQANTDPEAKLREAQVDIVATLAQKLKEAAEDRKPEKVRALEEEIARAMGLVRRVKALQTTNAAESPAEKFVIVWSANPDVVFDQIAQVVEKQESEGAILETVSALRRADETRAKQGDQLAETLWKGLLSDGTSLASPLAADAPDADAARAQKALTKSLETYRRRLRDFLEGAR